MSGDLYVWFLDGTVAVGGSYLHARAARGARSGQIRGTADLDADGHLDLLWHHQTTGELYVWFMDGLVVKTGAFLTPRSFSDTRWQIREWRTSSADGKPDLLWHNPATGELYAWLMNGTTSRLRRLPAPHPGAPCGASPRWRTSTATANPICSGTTRRPASSYFWFLDGLDQDVRAT